MPAAKTPPSIRLKLALPEPAVPPLPARLPDDVEALKALLLAQQAAHQQAIAQTLEHAMRHIDHLYEQFVLLRQRHFGASTEQSAGQAHLFDEAEVLAAASTPDQDQAPIPSQSDAAADAGKKSAGKPARGKRAPLPSDLPRVDIVHEVPEDQRLCPCGTPMVEIGEDVSEQLDIVPMQVRVLRHIRKRYGCPGSAHAPVVAALPAQPLPRSNASPDLLAMLLTVKYADGLSLARFEYVLERAGVAVPRQTLARWVIGAAGVLQPLHNLIRDELFNASVIHMDETVVQVLKERDRPASSQSYMWVQTGGPPERPVVVFDYDPSRSGAVPVRLLEGYQGYLMTDGYDGYNALAKTEGIEHLACLAHSRRRFVEATRVQPKGKRGRADEAIELIGRLYGIEREYKAATDDERHLARQTRSVPILAELRAWLDATLPTVPPKTALGEALAYLHKYWSRLVRYTERGDLPIDNNRCENSIRPFAVGRRRWMFCDTPAGAHASAVIYSLIETARANGLEPYTWLRRVMRELPAAQSVEAIEALLPWNLHRQDLATEMTP
ncbi:Transposase [Burkholderia sp. D7]|jgi:transposase|nr:Transposase [Burkholderia sp. D7]SOE91781.1 Transposase [Burkholderia sp. D7]